MKSLLNIVQEKLVITKDTKEKFYDYETVNFSKFCHELCLYDSSMNHNDLKELYDLYRNDCEHIISNEFKGKLLSTNFELMFMCAAMLNADDLDYHLLIELGTHRYKGDYNPYDFSWFEETDKDGKSVLDTIHDLYMTPRYLSKFIDMFRRIYEIIKKTCTSYRHAVDGIWELHTKI